MPESKFRIKLLYTDRPSIAYSYIFNSKSKRLRSLPAQLGHQRGVDIGIPQHRTAALRGKLEGGLFGAKAGRG